jgi:hypothetical protein
MPESILPANPVVSMLEIHPESDYFSPHPLPPPGPSHLTLTCCHSVTS